MLNRSIDDVIDMTFPQDVLDVLVIRAEADHIGRKMFRHNTVQHFFHAVCGGTDPDQDCHAVAEFFFQLCEV